MSIRWALKAKITVKRVNALHGLIISFCLGMAALHSALPGTAYAQSLSATRVGTKTVFAQTNPLPSALVEQEIRQALLGQTFDGEYADGRAWSERFNEDLTTKYQEDGPAVSGTMWFLPRQVCFRYGEASDFSGGCFEVWRRGANCFDFYGTGFGSGTSASLLQKEQGAAWTARAWMAGRPSTCNAQPIA